MGYHEQKLMWSVQHTQADYRFCADPFYRILLVGYLQYSAVHDSPIDQSLFDSRAFDDQNTYCLRQPFCLADSSQCGSHDEKVFTHFRDVAG